MDLGAVPLKEVKGITAMKEKELNGLGIFSVRDLIEYYPYRYEDYRIRALHDIKPGEKVTIEGKIATIPQIYRYAKNKTRLTCKVFCDNQLINAVWFNRHFLKDQLEMEREIVLTGKWEPARKQLIISTSEFKDRTTDRIGSLHPVYSIGGKITQKWIVKTIRQALQQFGLNISEIIPSLFKEKYEFIPRREAIMLIHYPQNTDEGKKARERIVYEEFFLFQLKLQAFRTWTERKTSGIVHQATNAKLREFTTKLPFEFTQGQKQAILEILEDMRSEKCMNRLLQGDVGSGKTVIAAVALFMAVASGNQGAFMAPTEILAEQHLRTLQRWFEPHGIQCGLLTGSLTEKKRRDMLAAMQMGLIDIVVGTHALIQEDVYFRNLSLVVTDEQHRFGVAQRSTLRKKGLQPDVLMMTATPIPRTLAISVFGDMDVSTLYERPKGRKPIQTQWMPTDQFNEALSQIKEQIELRHQAYVICPLIEESEKIDVQNVLDTYHQIQQEFSQFNVGLLHGKMTSAEKDAVMHAFSENQIQILVSTTVVEVGVDVPNATMMVIMDADRFGLSQLHQLRGRVGRGKEQSYCILMANPKNEIGQARMDIMTETDDGFEIARRDLDLRGPGDFFGTKQSGLPEFKIADLYQDYIWLERAREDAKELVHQSDFWTSLDNDNLRNYLQSQEVFKQEQLD